MGKKWIYHLKKDDFAHVAQRLNVAVEGRLDDMRKANFGPGEEVPHLDRGAAHRRATSITGISGMATMGGIPSRQDIDSDTSRHFRQPR